MLLLTDCQENTESQDELIHSLCDSCFSVTSRLVTTSIRQRAASDAAFLMIKWRHVVAWRTCCRNEAGG